MKAKVRSQLEIESSILERLMEQAQEAQSSAYAPYSDFKVGAAVLSADGSIYKGCNVENVSYGLTICAERSAVFNAVCHGVRKIDAVAVTCGTDENCAPCGACLQVLSEFDNADIVVLMGSSRSYRIKRLSELLPVRFRSATLERGPRTST